MAARRTCRARSTRRWSSSRALRPLEADALDALQAEVLAAAGRIQQAAAEKRAEEKQCAVCMDKEKDVALDPCGHRVCAVCSQSLDECPTCRQNIAGRIRLY